MAVVKTCTKCKEEKAEGEFGRDKNTKDGIARLCKKCNNTYSSNWRKANKESANRSMRKWRKKNPVSRRNSYNKWYENSGRFSVALTNSRRDAKRQGHYPCDATVEELEAAFTGFCHLCGVPEIECNRKLALDHDHDREDENFRGWLCDRHNKLLGLAGDCQEILIDAIHYLMAYEQQKQ